MKGSKKKSGLQEPPFVTQIPDRLVLTRRRTILLVFVFIVLIVFVVLLRRRLLFLWLWFRSLSWRRLLFSRLWFRSLFLLLLLLLPLNILAFLFVGSLLFQSLLLLGVAIQHSGSLAVVAVVVAAVLWVVVSQPLLAAAAGHVAVQYSGALAVAAAVDATGLLAVVAVVAFAARCSVARRAGDHWWPGGYPLDDSHSDYLETRPAGDLGSADSDSPHSACSDWHWADWHLADSQPADLD